MVHQSVGRSAAVLDITTTLRGIRLLWNTTSRCMVAVARIQRQVVFMNLGEHVRSFSHEWAGPVGLAVRVDAGSVDVLAETGRESVEVTLAPVRDGDAVATELIEQASFRADGDRVWLTVPSGRSRVAGTSTNVVSGNARVGVQVNSFDDDVVIVNGVVFAGRAIITGDGTVVSDGGVRVRVLVPVGSSLRVDTVSASVVTDGRLRKVVANTGSGEISIGGADVVNAVSVSGSVGVGIAHDVRAQTTSGDIWAGTVSTITAQSISGDVVVQDAGTSATVSTTSGDIDLTANSTTFDLGSATAISGDITIIGASTRVQARTISGRIRRQV